MRTTKATQNELWVMRWRIGEHRGRNVYAMSDPQNPQQTDEFIAMFDLVDLAVSVVTMHNLATVGYWGEM